MDGYSPWGHKESDTTECLSLSLCFFFFLYESRKVGIKTQIKGTLHQQKNVQDREKNPLTSLGLGTHYNLNSDLATHTQTTKVLRHGFLTVTGSSALNCVTSITIKGSSDILSQPDIFKDINSKKDWNHRHLGEDRETWHAAAMRSQSRTWLSSCATVTEKKDERFPCWRTGFGGEATFLANSLKMLPSSFYN